MMRKQNGFAALLTAVAVMSAVPAGMLFAYLTDRDTEENAVPVGVNTSVIEENFTNPDSVPDTGGTYEKEVWVENTESVPCYIRAAVLFSDGDVSKGVDVLYPEDTGWRYISPEEDAKLGGYYYYENAVAPGEETGLLMEKVSFSAEADASLMAEENFDIYIYEESVQQGSYGSYAEAWSSFLRE
ncbi:hypothetical protein LKD70_10665 [Ruminococcus sp. CLA-AA-H200]|uniref:Alternate signal-mediated exported protein, CPF_0494 family n=1 Tax=Ruminococcus turbiniformis TaxID=2881258 RepID=A0ABS8FY10_9FIRM|nr:hypothetical protein [Ruminococcus turbiniformis]MCC2254873.1 hypothetical protein [Ruminococcus turbiniformis]